MYARWIPFLNKKNIILASSSPRRKEIFSEFGFKFEIYKNEFEENISKDNISQVNTLKKPLMENLKIT